MIVWLVDYDGKIENLALMRLSAYHKVQGDTVRLKFGHATPELFEIPNRVYISCLFRWNRTQALALADAWGDRAIIGGTGVDIKKRLLPEIEDCAPDYSLYGYTRAIGFISRGCIRRCPWCVVPEKEGKLHRISHAYSIVRKKDAAMFLDNNFLALPDYHKDLQWIASMGIAISFNQGLDARLIDATAAKLLAKCRFYEDIHIGYDTTSATDSLLSAVEALQSAGISKGDIRVLTLIGLHGLESDVSRLLTLRRHKIAPFPMGYRDLETGNEPANGWDLKLYRKYRRLICRVPHASSVWNDFEREVEMQTLPGTPPKP